MPHDKFYGVCENKCLVELNAEKVGAATADHTHTAEEVGAASAEHTHTAAEVGAAAAEHTHTAEEVGAATADHTHTAEEVGAATAEHTHTAEEVGAAASSHTHAASAITSGTLGGTGASSASSARSNLGVWGQTTLYSNTYGTTGTITLSSSYTNYDVIGIYGRGMNDSYEQCYSGLHPSTGSLVSLSTTTHQGDQTTVWRSTKLSFSSTSVTFKWNRASSYSGTNDQHGYNSGDGIRVTRIVGYKY